MTPKEKAIELVHKFLDKIPFADTNVYKDWKKEMNDKSKQCALIAVDLRLDGDFIFTSIEYGEYSLEYWQEVKEEIEKL